MTEKNEPAGPVNAPDPRDTGEAVEGARVRGAVPVRNIVSYALSPIVDWLEKL